MSATLMKFNYIATTNILNGFVCLWKNTDLAFKSFQAC